MVDTITDSVESVIARNNAAGGPPRFMLQSAVHHALCDINKRRAPLRRFNGVRPDDSARRSLPRTPMLQFALGVCPTHGAAMFVRHLGTPPSSLARPPTPHQSALPWPSPSLMLPPQVPQAIAAHWNDNSAGAEAWPPAFAYGLDIALPCAPPLPPGTSFADVARRNALPPVEALGTATSVKGEAAVGPRIAGLGRLRFGPRLAEPRPSRAGWTAHKAAARARWATGRLGCRLLLLLVFLVFIIIYFLQ